MKRGGRGDYEDEYIQKYCENTMAMMIFMSKDCYKEAGSIRQMSGIKIRMFDGYQKQAWVNNKNK